MYDRDVELGLLSSRPSEALSNAGTLTSGNTHRSSRQDGAHARVSPSEKCYGKFDAAKPLAEGGAGGTWDYSTASEDEDFVKVPRRKVEQLMGMWIDVLQQSMQRNPSDYAIQETPIEGLYGAQRQHAPAMSTSRYPPISYPPNAHPWSAVEPMAQFELEAEDGWRSLGREMWKTPEHLAHLEDCWKHLWEPMVGVDKGLFQWAVAEEKRKAVQYQLVDALYANERIVTASMYMRRDFRTISNLIAMIGLRLNEQYRSYHRPPELGPIKQIRILIECIWACNAFDPSNDIKEGYREGPRLSNVLTACYRRGILNRPDEGFDELVTMTVLQRHCQSVRRSLHLINLLQKHEISGPMQCESLHQAREIWTMPLPDVEAPLKISYRSRTLRDRVDAFLRIDDFNLKDLQILGHLQIQWTSYWDEHLQLETSSTANILKIYWFQPKLARYLVENHLCSQLSSSELTRREDELFRTWCLIFTSKMGVRQSCARYKSLRAPQWLSLLGHTKLQTWTPEQATNNSPDSGPLLSKFTSPKPASLFDYCYEMHDHLLLQWSKDGRLPHERISYSQFPIYADRLRELRIYMDSQQPTGLRALWKDRRNSNTYYTFWFVTIFGSLSVFLATCALAVSIAQTWAAFRQLNK